MGAYQRVLAVRGVRSLMLLMFVARMPHTAAGISLTLHVAVTLDRGYGAAGLVGASVTIGTAIGAPVMGRIIDRYGLRRMLLLTIVGETAFWLLAPQLPYAVLLPAALVGGFLVIPAMSIGRQSLTALVPEEQRRTALSMDSISVEVSYMVGPTLVVLVASQVSTGAALAAVGLTVVISGILTFALNPPVQSETERAETSRTQRPRLRDWITPELLAVLFIGTGAVYVLSGMEVAVVAELRSYDQMDWTGVVMAVACLASIIGGLAHGAVRKSWSQIRLMLWMSALCVPVGLAGHDWWLLALVLVPMNLLCAPTIAATSENVAGLAPAAARGEANGVQTTAFTLGAAFGAPVTGFVMDHYGSGWGFFSAGVGGLLVVAVAAVLLHRNRQRALPEPAAPATGVG